MSSRIEKGRPGTLEAGVREETLAYVEEEVRGWQGQWRRSQDKREEG